MSHLQSTLCHGLSLLLSFFHGVSFFFFFFSDGDFKDEGLCLVQFVKSFAKTVLVILGYINNIKSKM